MAHMRPLRAADFEYSLARTRKAGIQILKMLNIYVCIPSRPDVEGSAFPPPEQRFGLVWEKPIFCFGVPNRCFGGVKTMPSTLGRPGILYTGI